MNFARGKNRRRRCEEEKGVAEGRGPIGLSVLDNRYLDGKLTKSLVQLGLLALFSPSLPLPLLSVSLAALARATGKATN